jgi:hypothetical protein
MPSEMNALLDRVSDSHSHNTRGARCNLFVNRENVKSIKNIAPKIWNALDEKLKGSGSVSSFKRRSKENFLLGYSKFRCKIKGCYSCNLPWYPSPLLPVHACLYVCLLLCMLVCLLLPGFNVVIPRGLLAALLLLLDVAPWLGFHSSPPPLPPPTPFGPSIAFCLIIIFIFFTYNLYFCSCDLVDILIKR